MSRYIRHVTPVTPAAAHGLVAEVYAWAGAGSRSVDLTFHMLSPAPEVLAAGWALMWEAQLIGTASASNRALVALGVSRVNACGYAEAAHLATLRRLGHEDLADTIAQGGTPTDPQAAVLLDWARATGTAGGPPVPPGEPVVEYFGAALATHFFNRLTLAMLPPGVRPVEAGPVDRAFEGSFGDAPSDPWEAFQDRGPGTSLSLLAGLPRDTAPPEWADATPVGAAYTTLMAVAERGGDLLTPTARELVSDVIEAYRGRRIGDSGELIEAALTELPKPEQAGARVAILAGLAPEALTDAQVAAWRATSQDTTDRRLLDHRTVLLLAYGAMTAVAHIEADLTRVWALSREARSWADHALLPTSSG